MSGGDVPRLLARERDELSAVVTPLREGRRVVAFLVCEARVRPVVLAYLREASGVEVPEPEEIRDPGRMLDALVEVASQSKSAVRSIALDHEVIEVVRTLNWHREKLRRGASVLLWFDGVQGLRALRAMAPDAYSFRDVMVVVQGEEVVRVMAPDAEPHDLIVAQHQLDIAQTPEDRADAARALVEQLHFHRPQAEARMVAERALLETEDGSPRNERARVARAGLLFWLAQTYSESQRVVAWRVARDGLREIDGVDSPEASTRRIALLSELKTPLGSDHASVRRAFGDLASSSEPPWLWIRSPLLLARSSQQRGDARGAREHLRAASEPQDVTTHNRGALALERGNVELTAGRLPLAQEQYAVASELFDAAGTGTILPAWGLAECFRAAGEIGSARKTHEAIGAHEHQCTGVELWVRLEVAGVDIDAGDLPRGLSGLRAVMHEAAESLHDRTLYQATSSYISSLVAIHDAGRLTPEDLTTAHAELDVAEDVALSIARDDPPWYTILYPGLRAELLALCPDRLDEAISLAATALERARARWTDAVPMHARMLVAHLVRADRLDDARAALAVAEPEAEAQRYLRELSRLRAHAVAVLVRAGAPVADVQAKLAALRATLGETDAPRIVADTLLELSRLLPASSAAPDPQELLDEAYALFVEMPIPAQEARCLEVMGDVLAARGDPTDGRRRYLAAKGTYERYGLGLRVPAVERKLG